MASVTSKSEVDPDGVDGRGVGRAGDRDTGGSKLRTLRSRGVIIRKTIDTVIATWCIERGCFLLHADRDFEPFVKHLGLREVI